MIFARQGWVLVPGGRLIAATARGSLRVLTSEVHHLGHEVLHVPHHAFLAVLHGVYDGRFGDRYTDWIRLGGLASREADASSWCLLPR